MLGSVSPAADVEGNVDDAVWLVGGLLAGALVAGVVDAVVDDARVTASVVDG
jgi:hypothetical protein